MARSHQEKVSLGPTALRQGVLLGRYERCQLLGHLGPATEQISRVHLLVIQLDGALWAVDTASSNGTCSDGEAVKVVRLQQGTHLELAGEEVSVAWWMPN